MDEKSRGWAGASDYFSRENLKEIADLDGQINFVAELLNKYNWHTVEKAQLYAIINVSAFMQFPRIGGVFGFICVCPEYLSKNEEWSSFEYPVQQKGI